MIDWHDPDGRPRREMTRPKMARWVGAAMLVLTAHGIGAWMALNWQPADSIADGPPPAVQIDLAPLDIASPPALSPDFAPGPQMIEAQPVPTPDTPTPVDEKNVAPSPPAATQDTNPAPPEKTAATEAVKPDTVAPVPPDVPVPPAPEKDKADALLAPPPAPKPRKEKKPPPPKHHLADRKRPVSPDQPKQEHTTAPPGAQAQRPTAAAVTGAVVSLSVSPTTWKSTLMARLNHYKRYPSGATGAGTTTVAFTIDRSGQVLTAHLIRSSGDPALDEEAVALPRRASPLPAPPSEVGGSTLTLAVPIRFDH